MIVVVVGGFFGGGDDCLGGEVGWDASVAAHHCRCRHSKKLPSGKRVFITNLQGTFFGMSESGEASKRR